MRVWAALSALPCSSFFLAKRSTDPLGSSELLLRDLARIAAHYALLPNLQRIAGSL